MDAEISLQRLQKTLVSRMCQAMVRNIAVVLVLLLSQNSQADEFVIEFESRWESSSIYMPASLRVITLYDSLKAVENISKAKTKPVIESNEDASVQREVGINVDQSFSLSSKVSPSSETITSFSKSSLDRTDQADSLQKEMERIQQKWPILKLQQNLELKMQNIENHSIVRRLTLINLNKVHHDWYLLGVTATTDVKNQFKTSWYHIENVQPEKSEVTISKRFNEGIIIKSQSGSESLCSLWNEKEILIQQKADERKPFISLCDEGIYLRFRVDGYRTTKEWVVEFLRDKVWGGESITDIVKRTIYKDKYLIETKSNQEKIGPSSHSFLVGENTPSQLQSDKSRVAENKYHWPQSPLMSEKFKSENISVSDVGLEIEGASDENKVIMGQWYKVRNQHGVFFSALKAEGVSEEVTSSYRSYVEKLDSIEQRAAAYFVAFDLSQHQLNFALGTEHPRLEWSSRSSIDQKNNLPGPDGFDDTGPIVSVGIIPPHKTGQVTATFTGGFKRSHGAFKWGTRAKLHNGTHYGFMENGVVFSRLHLGLMTLIIYKDGQVDIKPWQSSDDAKINQIRHARQNGVPIIRYDEEKNKGVPGRLVSNWTLGNWSGSQEGKLRSLRAGVCLANFNERKFLIYGYFSSVTPAAMARLFQSYQCQAAMHLDMNALEHTYLAIYDSDKKRNNRPFHIIKGMKVLDERFKGNVPRFIGYPDNRDFFYLTRSRND